MPKKENYTSPDGDSVFLYRGKLLNLEFYRKSNHNSFQNVNLLEDIKLVNKTRKNTSKSEYKYLSLVIAIIALLSIGMCIQADSLAQSLREIAIISVQETIYIK